MKIAELPQAVLNDLCDEQRWRLDIDPGFDAKHEFWLAWHHFQTMALEHASAAPGLAPWSAVPPKGRQKRLD
jgi:hypothetical protein